MEPHGGSPPRFPLNPEKRPKFRVIDQQTVNWWKQQARQEIAALMRDKKSWYYKGKDAKQHKELRLSFSKHGIRGYTASPSSPSKAVATRKSAYFCHGVLNLSLEDIAYALYCDNTSDQHTIAACLYQESFLDAAVLDVYDRKSVEDPFHFAGVKWVAFKIPPGLVAPSDLVYFEYSCKTRDVDGSIVLVQYTMCPELVSEQMDEQNVGLARAQTSQISTFRFLEEGTHCQSAGWFESSPVVPAWVAGKTVQQIFSNMGHLVGLADARAIASLGTAASASTAKACYLCSKKFGMMHKRHNCRSCGQSICAKCTIKLKVLNSPQSEQQRLSQSHSSSASSSNSSPKFLEDKFCLPCVLQAREQRPDSGSFSGMASSLSSEESNTTAPPSIDEGYDIDLSELQDSIDDLDLSDLDDLDDPYLLNHHGHRHQAQGQYSNHRHSNNKIAFTDGRRKPVSAVEAYLAAQAKDTSKKSKKRVTSHPPGSIGTHCGWSAPPAIAEEEQFEPRASRLRRQPSRHSKPEQQQQHQADRNTHAQAAPVPMPQQPMPMPAAFNNISQSIAAQEALLQTIQQERQKFHARRRVSSEIPNLVPDNGRFEVISEAD